MKTIVLVAHGLRPAELGLYGAAWLPTPNLDRLASESVVFDQHFVDCPSSSTFRARYSLPESKPIPSALPDGAKLVEYRGLLPPWDIPEELLAEQFEDWPFEDDSTPWLGPPPGFIDRDDPVAFGRLRRTYAAAVRQFDDWLGELLERFTDELMIVTSPRGQNLGEHGIIGDHRPWLHEELVHVPLIVRLPNREQAGRRVGHLTQTVDIAATVFDFCGFQPPADGHGYSLLPMCHGGGPLREFVAMAHSCNGASELVLQTPDLKVILPTKTFPEDPPRPPMFFVKPDDRWDVNDLRQQNLDYAEQLERTLLDFTAANQRPGPLVAPPLPKRETDHADRETR